MNNNILIWRQRQRQIHASDALSIRECGITHLLKGVEVLILGDRYDVVTPFGCKEKRYRRRCLLGRYLTGWE